MWLRSLFTASLICSGATPSDTARHGQDGRVTTQTTTQTGCHPSGPACRSDCPYSALIMESRKSETSGQLMPPWNRQQQSGEGRNLRAAVRNTTAYVRSFVPACSRLRGSCLVSPLNSPTGAFARAVPPVPVGVADPKWQCSARIIVRDVRVAGPRRCSR